MIALKLLDNGLTVREQRQRELEANEYNIQ